MITKLKFRFVYGWRNDSFGTTTGAPDDAQETRKEPAVCSRQRSADPGEETTRGPDSVDRWSSVTGNQERR